MKRILTLSLLLAATAAHAQFDALRTLTPEQGQEVRRPIEAKLFGATLNELPALEKELLEIFQADGTTLEGKQYTCRMLRHCASEACVPVLAPELLNPELSEFVRRVFQSLQAPAADAALVAALANASDALKPGIIGTLGQRRSSTSVKPIAPYLKDANAELQRAAIAALGNIGGKDALKALSKAKKVSPELVVELKQAQLQAGQSMDSKLARKIHGELLKDNNETIRCAALVGLARANPEATASTVLASLDSDSARLAKTATGLLATLPTAMLIEGIDGLEPGQQVRVIGILADRQAKESEIKMLQLTASQNATIKHAAFQALAQVGGAGSIETLLAACLTSPAASDALCGLQANGVDAQLCQVLETSTDEKLKIKMIECLSARQANASLPAIANLAKGDWSRITAAAINALPNLVGEKDFSLFADLLLTSGNTKTIQAVEKAIVLAAQRLPDANACAQPLIDAYPNAEGEANYAIIRTLGGIGGEAAKAMLTQALGSPVPEIKDAAIRGLANWPSLDAAGQLLELATTTDSEKHQVIALRGYIRLANTETDPNKNFEMCMKAAAATDRAPELKSIIGCVKKNKTPEVLGFLAAQLDNPEVFTEAAWAICEVSNHWNLKEASIPILRRIAETKDEKLANEANSRIKDYQN
ncbi:hypothetical protein PDESU_06501 [Pontiella desulfatans]|uniref:HEAT repeat domain-containing protein n=1 Tax=Pontiella desulfatans TaxID=2750659 RepID=A0A6C2UDC8_PONDE|nr:HEAT repeat domain-containing protein [Pontiella desulfatans]VGO17899.1 hypothetical protein PDESU_06501 [Pontiella desulfatans]